MTHLAGRAKQLGLKELKLCHFSKHNWSLWLFVSPHNKFFLVDCPCSIFANMLFYVCRQANSFGIAAERVQSFIYFNPKRLTREMRIFARFSNKSNTCE
jgi:hypothetical protein